MPAIISPSAQHKEVLKYQFKNVEKIPTKIWEDSRDASRHIAQSIALAMRQKPFTGPCPIATRVATGWAVLSSCPGV